QGALIHEKGFEAQLRILGEKYSNHESKSFGKKSDSNEKSESHQAVPKLRNRKEMRKERKRKSKGGTKSNNKIRLRPYFSATTRSSKSNERSRTEAKVSKRPYSIAKRVILIENPMPAAATSCHL
ncbi:unnamed protein product, partial [Ilex paraguariensis]